ncbi:MAG TPA: FtsH protease activity modulator HflK [Verrucomicrobiae bacterium]|jgi:membrane protease subunit HflK|nr:FtsH protease activity modulator HflK [Verrucomicrobiae bacterium]
MDVNFPDHNKLPPFRWSPWMLPFFAMMLVFTAAGTLFYEVGPDEVSVVQRFGKYVRTEPPGLRMKLPFGVETAKKVKVTHVFKEEFGFRTMRAGVRTVYEGRDEYPAQGQMRMTRQMRGPDPFLEESLMLTGDLNVAVVEWIVQYTIKDPVKYLFRVREPRETIRNMSEAVMRLVVGDHTVNQVLTAGRVTIQGEAEKMLQDLLDSYGAGIAVENVILQDVTPPNEVKPSFNLVNEARQEKEKLINNAWEEYNRVIPKAKGQSEQVQREAEGYAVERVNKAQGDADRFLLQWEAYKGAPDVTKRRLYLEMVQDVLPQMQDKLIMDDQEKGVLPLLNLNPGRKEGNEQ